MRRGEAGVAQQLVGQVDLEPVVRVGTEEDAQPVAGAALRDEAERDVAQAAFAGRVGVRVERSDWRAIG